MVHEPQSGSTELADDSPRASRWPWAWGVLGGLILLGGVGWFYRAQEQEIRSRVEERLSSTARLKAEQIERWRKDQWVDAALIADHPGLPQHLAAGPKGRFGAAVSARLQAFFQQIQREHDYDGILIAEGGGEVLWSLEDPGPLHPDVVAALATALRERRRVQVEYTVGPAAGTLRSTVVAPLSDHDDKALVLINDASRSLRPLLFSWPTISRSGETLLVQREGEHVRILEGSRHEASGNPSLRFPASHEGMPTVRAALGERAVMVGRDYRGVEVLAALEAIPGSSWSLVSKLDVDEALAEWRLESRLILGLFLLLSTTLMTTALVFWQHRRQKHLRRLYGVEAERRAIAERYVTTLKAIGDAVIVTDAQGRIDLLNAVAEGLTGWSHAEARGKRLDEVFRIFNAETRQVVESPLERVVREGVVVGLANHTLLRSRDGLERPIADSGAPVFDDQGAVVGVVLVFRDESERYAQEQALLKSEARGRAILECAPDAIYVQVRGRFAYLNSAGARLFGAARADDLLGTPLLERFDPAQHDAIRERIRTVNEAREPVELLEETVITLSGESTPVEVTAVPVEFDGGPGALVFVRDIRKRKEEQAQRERLTMAVEQLAEAVVITDPAGTMLYVNPACERQTGYARAELIGQNPRLLNSGEQDPAFYRRMWETIRAGETWHGRMRNRRKDGDCYTVEAAITPVVNAAGEVSEFISIQLDVTEQLALEEQLRHAQRLSAIGQLAGGVAHDFNNLLTVINGYGELASERAGDDEVLRRHLSKISEAGARAASLTGQLLAFSRKQVLQPRVLDMNHLLEGMSDMLRRLLGEDVALALKPQPGLGLVKVDPGQLEQVILNLAVNARDTMPRGGKLTIETADVELDESYLRSHADVRPGPHVLLAVSDTGHGMVPEVRERVFEPFFTTKPQGKGTGLGLATVYGIVKQSGGDIWVYSEPGQGTTFKIYLPQAQSATASALDVAPVRARSVGGHEAVLVAEDEHSVRQLICDVLKGAGYRVLATADVEEALRLCRAPETEIDLLLTDVVLPKLSGRELADRAVAARPGLKVVYMSGYTDNAIVQHGVLEPGTPFIAKPFSPDELLRKLRTFLA